MTIASTQDLISELKAGRMVILIDEEDRENEGDLVLAADHVSPEAINFMAKHGRGLICLTLTGARCAQLNLPLMVSHNGTKTGTNFTISIEAAEGVTTGISAADRARTIAAAVAANAKSADIVQPGHIFPIRAVDGGVLMRAGHTEAGCDLTAMAGLNLAAVICEIMKDDGTMARLPDLLEFGRTHGLKIGTIAELIQYRAATESLVEKIATRQVKTAHGPLQAVMFRDKPSGKAHLALIKGQIDPDQETLARVHEPVSILDLIDTECSTHSWPVDKALAAIAAAPQGVLVLLNCGESTAHLQQQFAALAEVDQSGQASQASVQYRMDLRTYGVGAQILKAVNVGKMKLLGKPRKMPSMTGFDLEVTGYQDSPTGECA